MNMKDDYQAMLSRLEEFCSLKQIRRALSRSDDAGVTAELGRAMQKMLAAEQAGTLDTDELTELVNFLFVILHYDCFYGTMQRLDCDLEDSYAAREAMCAEYSRWKKDGVTGDGEWLLCERKNADLPAVKARLFAVLDALCLPVGDFCEFAPPETTQPKWVRKAFADFELVTICDAVITDDGGLRADPHPNGKSFTMTDADTAVYHLGGVRETTDTHADMNQVMFSEDTPRSFTAMGWIEGYTGRQRREIEFTMLPDGTAVFSFSTQGVNDEAAETDPRWGGYEAWAESRIAYRRQYQAEFIERHRAAYAGKDGAAQ
ncbi:MAG: hypothetical protein K6E36_00230 [Oscillospiraceae bacterium]|nr:hypothetical protein [Oscillospiraceae bacterium]MCR5304917.1 hypothetical protein [Oscillospiraceae bacterium]